MDTPAVHLVFSVDELMAIPLAAAAGRAVARTTGAVVVNIIDVGIRRHSFDRIRESLTRPGVEVRRLVPDLTRLAGAAAQSGSRYPLAAFARILLPELLPGLDRVVYLDGDLLVERDVRDLWSHEFGGNLALAAVDADAAGRIGNLERLDWRAMGAAADAPLVNTGVMAIDLDGWRRAGVTEMCFSLMARFRGSFAMADQDVLNMVLAGRVGTLDPRWNVYTTLFDGPCALDPAERRRVVADPWIVHFTHSPKPWQRGCTHPLADRFLTSIDETAWKGWRPHRYRTLVADARRAARRASCELNRRRVSS